MHIRPSARISLVVCSAITRLPGSSALRYVQVYRNLVVVGVAKELQYLLQVFRFF